MNFIGLQVEVDVGFVEPTYFRPNNVPSLDQSKQ
jgi:hypothetical protein